jgi:hypothetical protein
MREMSLTVERFREATDGGLQSMGAWMYGIGARPEGPIVIEELKDAILRYFDGSPASGERDRVKVCRDDLIEPEPVWGQFVETFFTSKDHTFTVEVVWVVGDCTAIRVAFIHLTSFGKIFANSRKLNSEPKPEPIAQRLGFMPYP